MEHADVIIIGAGAAGLMCALTAGRRGRRVVVLEGSNRIGKKILMSGGGRCNFTNLYTEASKFIGENRHFCKSALSRYTQHDFIALLEKNGVGFHEKTLGQLFCDNSSKDIVAVLAKECEASGVTILTDCVDTTVRSDAGYTVRCSKGAFGGTSLVLATGGLSIPKMGASDVGYRIARQFSLRVVQTSAGLVPFTFTGAVHDICARLSGVSCRAAVTVADVCFTENMLFTHRGLSGPVILQASSYWSPGKEIVVNLLPDVDCAGNLLATKRSRPRSSLRNALAERLPRALVKQLQERLWPELRETMLGSISDEKLRKIAHDLQYWAIRPAATEGYRTAEVTIGGIDSNELSSRTMESKRHPGLYFIGELVDVTGHLGGFNFQWAWSSGWAAGQAV